MEWFAIPAVLAFYALSAIIAHRNAAFLFSAYLTLALFNDFVILRHLRGTDALSGLLVQAWREIFVLIALSLYLRSRAAGQTTAIAPMLRAIVAILLYGATVALLRGDAPSDVYATTRRIGAPVLFAGLIFAAQPLRQIRLVQVWSWALACSLVFALYALHVELSVGHAYRSLWFYDFVTATKTAMQLDERLVQYQFFRDGDLRVSSFLISSVDYALYSGMCALFAAIAFLRTAPSLRSVLFALVAAANLYATVETETRAGLIICLGGLALYAFHSVIRLARREILSVVMALSACAVIVLSGAFAFEASVAGRAEQYASILSEFRFLGYGTGTLFDNAPTYKDSFYLSVANSYGVFFLPVLLWMWRLHRTAFTLIASAPLTETERMVFCGVAVFFQILIFVLAFHYFIGGPAYICAVFLALMARARLGEADDIKGARP